MEQLSPEALRRWIDDATRPAPVLLDVRETWEMERCRLANVVHIPMGTIPARAAELDATRPIVVICHHGGRSAQVAMFLTRQGFTDVYNLQGGMHAWATRVEPGMPTY